MTFSVKPKPWEVSPAPWSKRKRRRRRDELFVYCHFWVKLTGLSHKFWFFFAQSKQGAHLHQVPHTYIHIYISIFICPIYVTHVWRLTILLSKTCMAAGDAAAPAAAASATADWRYILERLYKEQDLQCAEVVRIAAVSTSSFVFLHRVSLTFTTMLCLYKSENLSKLFWKFFWFSRFSACGWAHWNTTWH